MSSPKPEEGESPSAGLPPVAAPTAAELEVAALTQAARMHGVLTPGSTFGVYVVGASIGEGGMARIYRAEHAGLRRQVALKVLINGFAKDPEGRERFVREARIAAAIKHPNVVNIFDVGVHDNIPYLVMELLEGIDLESLVESKGALEESQILDIMVPVIAGLSAVHDSGIVHRDLKPGNIFLARGRYEELEPKLLDFGISKAAGPDQLRLTTRGLLIGTPLYMSPEGLRGEEMSPLSDQYSLGVLMYECATGRGPFTAATLPELVRVISSGEYPSPDELNPKLSKRLTRIILRAMSLDPAARYKDMREMGRELLQLAGQRTRITWGLSFGELPGASPAAQLGTAPPMAGTVPAAPEPRERGFQRRWAFAGAALVILVLLLTSTRRDDGGAASTSAAGKGPEPAPLSPVAAASSDAAAGAPLELRVQPLGPASASASTPTSNRPVKRGAASGARLRSPAEALPEWALPNSNASTGHATPSESRVASGTNGAPIFD
jgi:eukaryotic-like serine/threonine-protein kinase